MASVQRKAKRELTGGAAREGFVDQAAIVTGAGSGMGRATALLLARRGVAVAVVDRDAAAAADTAAAIVKGGGRGESFTLDVSRSARVDAVVKSVARRMGPVGYLANIAGHDALTPLEAISDAEWSRMFEVAVNGAFYLCRAVLPGMMQRRFGSIVNMSSLHAVRGQAGRAHYASAKAAIIGLTKSLAREKGALNIRVNAVAPGPIDTPLWRAGRRGPGLRRDMRERARVIPLGRLGEPEEIAEVIAFLLSARSSYVTGAVLTADGGEIMP